ncbi:PilZ domain-containing protein [Henriciella marina]|uniref:PilZ domain-containing protein n=1 Tax=Henriciella marina TaxID=453851 RepID=UPI0003810596|nr:PilZ domain-containing protein [Henriciella marina]
MLEYPRVKKTVEDTMMHSKIEMPLSDNVDKRDFPRFDVNTSGTLILDTGFKLSFVVKDMSQRGAKILLNKTSILPDTFTVEIVSPDRSKLKRCSARRQWQRGPLVGIRLLSAKTITL